MSDTPKSGLNFNDYDCIGFDLDNTLCQYKIRNLIKLEYAVLSEFLVNKKGYCKNHLLKPLEDNEDFLLKGLILDLKNGNILKISSDGRILCAAHGTKQMSFGDIKKCYGESCHWNIADVFCNDPLETWNGPLSEEMRSLLDYFDLPAGLAFARSVDYIDEKYGKRPGQYAIWPDILDGLINMYDRFQFEKNEGDYFPTLKMNPQLYIENCSNDVLNWLKTMKSRKKVLFLITGSYVDFASLTASTSIGNDWKELFDLVIFFAKKPGFFTGSRPFLLIKDGKETDPVKDIQTGEFYSQGNWNDLYKFLSKTSGKKNPKVVYMGDNLIQDIYTPARHCNVDTVAIVEELLAEGVLGFSAGHSEKDLLSSVHWGSFFTHTEDNVDSIWMHILQKCCKLYVPSVQYIASHPVDHIFYKNT